MDTSGRDALRMPVAALVIPLLVALVLAGFAAMSYLQPFTADDYGNLAILIEHPTLPSFVNHWYTMWNGRMTGETLEWFALQWRKPFALANGLAFGALVLLSFGVAAGRMPRADQYDPLVIASILITYWFGLPVPAETLFWVSGSVMYLWAAVLMLSVIYPYRRWLESPEGPQARRRTALAAIGMLLLGIVAGLSNEIVVVVLGFLSACFVAAMVQRHLLRAVPAHLWVGLVGLIIGSVVLALSPGSSVRASYAPDAFTSEQLTQFAWFMGVVYSTHLAGLYPWLIHIVALGLRATSTSVHRPVRQSRLWLVWPLASIAALAVFVAIPMFASDRTTFFSAVLLTISAVALLTRQNTGLVLHSIPWRVIAAILGVALIVILSQVQQSMLVSRAIRGEVYVREAYIAGRIGEGYREVAVPPVQTQGTRTVLYWDIEPEPDNYINEAVAAYYGLDSIRVDPSVSYDD